MAASNPWITRLRSNAQASLRLFCFPYAGGSSLTFRGWEAHLPATVELCPIELPGRGLRLQEPAFERLAPLAEATVQALLPYLDKPFALFGHSMGALLSFEVARRLRRMGQEPGQLFVSGRRAPQWPDPDPPIHALPEAEFIAELRRLNGTPAAVLENRELMQLLLPTLRADFAVLDTYGYEPEPPLSCPIVAFGGLQDPDVTCEMLEAWRQQTCSGFSLQMLPGDHFFLHRVQPLLGQTLHRALASLIPL